MLPEISPATAEALRTALERASYRTDGCGRCSVVRRTPRWAAASRSRPTGPAADGGELGVLVRLLLLGAVEPDGAVRAALAPLVPTDAAAAGLLRRAGDGWAAALDLRPYGEGGTDEAGPAEWWVLSDLDARRQERDHVIGVGGASLTLASATVRTPAGSALDLGTGSGVQALHASRYARTVTATDVAPRALAMARATFALNGLDVEVLDGPWLAPVAGRRFDLIVSNPPFVPGPARVDYVYRDSGQSGDDALAALVGALPDHLEPGGTAQLLASWLHVRGQDWPDRVRSWVPERRRRVGRAARGDRRGPARRHLAARRRCSIPPHPRGARRRVRGWTGWRRSRWRRWDSGSSRCVESRTVLPTEAGPTASAPSSSRTCRATSTTRWGRRSRAGWTASAGSVPTPRTTRCWARDCASPRASCSSGTRRRARRAGHPPAPPWPAPRGRDGGTRSTSPRPRCWPDCRGVLPLGELVALLALAHDRPVDALVAAALPAVREMVRHGLLVPDEAGV